MLNTIKSAINSLGFQLTRFPGEDIRRRFQLIEHYKIDKIFDIGANTGGYASSLRKFGYKKQIISFEPLTDAYRQLEKKAANDAAWQTKKMAVGNEDGKAVINVSKNLVSSSLADINSKHVESEPMSQYVSTEEIDICKIDSIFNSYVNKGEQVFLKIDTQGFEKNVIDGALESLPYIAGIQMEMSIVPLYSNELLFADMLKYVAALGFELYSLENGFTSPSTGQLLQVDGIFFRK